MAQQASLDSLALLLFKQKMAEILELRVAQWVEVCMFAFSETHHLSRFCKHLTLPAME